MAGLEMTTGSLRFLRARTLGSREREAGWRVAGNFTSDERKPIKLNDLGGEHMVKFAGSVWPSRPKRLYKFGNGGVYRVNL